MNEIEKTTVNGNVSRIRPRLSFYHPNMRGTGCAVAFELIPASGDADGCIMLSAANQSAIANGVGENKTYARFDWQNKLTIKLNFADLSKMLQVFRGESESIDGGKGLYHNASAHTTRIVLRHLIEPVQGYSLELYRTIRAGGEMNAHIFFSACEALGLCESIAGSMSLIAFGVPKEVFNVQTK